MLSQRSVRLAILLSAASVVLLGVLAAYRVRADRVALAEAREPLTVRLSLDVEVFSYATHPLAYGKVYLTNRSRKDISIYTELDLGDHLRYRFFDELDREVASGTHLSVRSTFRDRVEVISPGETRWEWAGSSTLSYKELPPGRYTIQAVYRYGNLYAESERVPLTIVP